MGTHLLVRGEQCASGLLDVAWYDERKKHPYSGIICSSVFMLVALIDCLCYYCRECYRIVVLGLTVVVIGLGFVS